MIFGFLIFKRNLLIWSKNMFLDKKVIAIIPARKGSKGIPNKNIRIINGIPLIAHTILAARESKYIDYIFVSTDSLKIANISIKYGADVPFLRPSILADDNSKTIDSVIYSLEELQKNNKFYDVLVLLQPTSPLRTVQDIDSAIELYFEEQRDVVSVNKIDLNPFLVRRFSNGRSLAKLINNNSTIRRQDLPTFYKVNGSIYVNNVKKLSPFTSFNDNPVGFVMDNEHSIDIDTVRDLKTARSIMKK